METNNTRYKLGKRLVMIGIHLMLILSLVWVRQENFTEKILAAHLDKFINSIQLSDDFSYTLTTHESTKLELVEIERRQWKVGRNFRVFGWITLETWRFDQLEQEVRGDHGDPGDHGDRGDHYYFVRYEPQVDDEVELSLKIPMVMKDFEYKYIYYPREVDHRKSVWSDTLGGSTGDLTIEGAESSATESSATESSATESSATESSPTESSTLGALTLGTSTDDAAAAFKLPQYSVFAAGDKSHAFLSYVQIFDKAEHRVKQEKRLQRRGLQIDEEGIRMSFPHEAHTVVEQWGMISAEPLTNLNDADNLDLLKRADLNMTRKWTLEGPLEITPTTYEPYSPSNFYVNPSYWVAQMLMKHGEGRFVENMSLLSLYTAVRTFPAEGYWPITTKSAWLYKDYGIEANYYDTRWSTDAAVFLMEGFRKYGDPLFLKTAEAYAASYLQFADDYHYKTVNGGILVWDYMQAGNDRVKPVHVSLNHLLAEMNFLYELYELTQDERYLGTAQKIKTAVQDTRLSWVNEVGDLHYRYQPDGTYTGKDYPLLTLNDLHISLLLIERVEGYTDEHFQLLIDAKEEYLTKHNMPLN